MFSFQLQTIGMALEHMRNTKTGDRIIDAHICEVISGVQTQIIAVAELVTHTISAKSSAPVPAKPPRKPRGPNKKKKDAPKDTQESSRVTDPQLSEQERAMLGDNGGEGGES